MAATPLGPERSKPDKIVGIYDLRSVNGCGRRLTPGQSDGASRHGILRSAGGKPSLLNRSLCAG
jgi:hypothetical protein